VTHISALTGQAVDLSGVTVNERLFDMALIKAWEGAARVRDRARMVEILSRVEVGEDTADAVLANPGFYGF
jgi:hypothetical protein